MTTPSNPRSTVASEGDQPPISSAKLVRELPNISGEVGALVGKLVPERLPALLKKHGLTP